MPMAITRITPIDYDAWHAVHVEAVRRFKDEMTLQTSVIYRDYDDPRTVVLLFEVEDVEQFKAIIATETFAGLGAQGALEGDPTFWFADHVEDVDLDAEYAPLAAMRMALLKDVDRAHDAPLSVGVG